jgi:hypothetical protein
LGGNGPRQGEGVGGEVCGNLGEDRAVRQSRSVI